MTGHCQIWGKKNENAPGFLKFSLKDVLSCANLNGLVTNLTILEEYISPINDLSKSDLQFMC